MNESETITAKELLDIKEIIVSMRNHLFGDPKILNDDKNSLSYKVDKIIDKFYDLQKNTEQLTNKVNENEKRNSEAFVRIETHAERITKLEKWQDKRETEAKTWVSMAQLLQWLIASGVGAAILSMVQNFK